MTWGGPWAFFDPATFSSRESLEYSAPTMAEGTIWILVLSPPDPDAGVWSGTIGPGGTIIWPGPIDPTPSGNGTALLPDDPTGINYLGSISAVDNGINALPQPDDPTGIN